MILTTKTQLGVTSVSNNRRQETLFSQSKNLLRNVIFVALVKKNEIMKRNSPEVKNFMLYWVECAPCHTITSDEEFF